MSIKQRLVRGTGMMVLARIFSIALMLVINGLLARWMSKAEFASFLVGTNLLILMGLLGMAGLNQSIIRLVSGRRDVCERPASILSRCWSVAGLGSLISVVIFAFLLRTSLGAWLQCDPKIITAILVCSVLVSAHKLLASSLRSVHAVAMSSILEGRSGGPLGNALFLLIVVLAFSKGISAPESFVAFAIALALTLPVGIWMLRRAIASDELAPAQSRKVAADGVVSSNIWLFSLPFLVTQLLAYFSSEFDVLLAKAYVDSESTAFYGGARRLALLVMVPMQILTPSIAPSIAKLYAEGDRQTLSKLLRYSSTAASVITLPVMLLCIVFAKPILGLAFGDEYRDASLVFSIVAAGQMANCLTGQCGNLLALSGNQKPLILYGVLSSIALIFVGAWSATNYGIVGLAVTSALLGTTQNVLLWITARVKVGYWTHPGFIFRRPRKRKRSEESIESL